MTYLNLGPEFFNRQHKYKREGEQMFYLSRVLESHQGPGINTLDRESSQVLVASFSLCYFRLFLTQLSTCY